MIRRALPAESYLVFEMHKLFRLFSNSHYENNFGVCSAYGAANTKIVFFESAAVGGTFKKNNFYNEICR